MTILSWNDMWKLVTLLDSVTVVLSICACHHWNECIWNIFAISKFKCLSWPVQHGRALRKTAYRNSNCGARHPAKWPGGTNGDQKETSTMRAPSVSKNTPYDPQQRGPELFFRFYLVQFFLWHAHATWLVQHAPTRGIPSSLWCDMFYCSSHMYPSC